MIKIKQCVIERTCGDLSNSLSLSSIFTAHLFNIFWSILFIVYFSLYLSPWRENKMIQLNQYKTISYDSFYLHLIHTELSILHTNSFKIGPINSQLKKGKCYYYQSYIVIYFWATFIVRLSQAHIAYQP